VSRIFDLAWHCSDICGDNRLGHVEIESNLRTHVDPLAFGKAREEKSDEISSVSREYSLIVHLDASDQSVVRRTDRLTLRVYLRATISRVEEHIIDYRTCVMSVDGEAS
jgi:hypothetical protein